MTEELLKIQVKNDQQLVSARDLHRGLGLTTRFSKWVEQNFKDFELGEDYTSVTAVTVEGELEIDGKDIEGHTDEPVNFCPNCRRDLNDED